MAITPPSPSPAKAAASCRRPRRRARAIARRLRGAIAILGMLAVAMALALGACGGDGKKRKRVATAQGVQTGKASWYGGKFHGGPTASGETYNKRSMTAAHRSLPFGTRVRVTNLRNGRSVVVRINNRGPYSKGRIIDLSEAAAEKLGMIEAGVVPVRLERLSP